MKNIKSTDTKRSRESSDNLKKSQHSSEDAKRHRESSENSKKAPIRRRASSEDSKRPRRSPGTSRRSSPKDAKSLKHNSDGERTRKRKRSSSNHEEDLCSLLNKNSIDLRDKLSQNDSERTRTPVQRTQSAQKRDTSWERNTNRGNLDPELRSARSKDYSKKTEISTEDKTNVLNVTNLKKKVDDHERLKTQLKKLLVSQKDITKCTELNHEKERVKRDIKEQLNNPTYPNNCLILHAEIQKSAFESEDIPDMFGRFGTLKEFVLFERQAVVEFYTVNKNKFVEDRSFTIKFTNLNRNIQEAYADYENIIDRDIINSSDKNLGRSLDRDLGRDLNRSSDKDLRVSTDRDLRTSSDKDPRTSSDRGLRISSDRDIGRPPPRTREDELLQNKNVDLKDVLEEMKSHGGYSIPAHSVHRTLDESSSWEQNQAYPHNRFSPAANQIMNDTQTSYNLSRSHDIKSPHNPPKVQYVQSSHDQPRRHDLCSPRGYPQSHDDAGKPHTNQRTPDTHLQHVSPRTQDVQSTSQHHRVHNLPYVSLRAQSNNEQQHSRTCDKGCRDVDIRKPNFCIYCGVESDFRTCVGCLLKRPERQQVDRASSWFDVKERFKSSYSYRNEKANGNKFEDGRHHSKKKQSELNFCLSPSPDRQQRQQRFPRPIIDESARAYYQPSADSETSADDLAVNRVEYGVDIVAKPKPRRTSIDRQVTNRLLALAGGGGDYTPTDDVASRKDDYIYEYDSNKKAGKYNCEKTAEQASRFQASSDNDDIQIISCSTTTPSRPIRSNRSKDTEDPPIIVNASMSLLERVDKYADSRSQIEKLMSGASIDTSENASEIEEEEITDSFVVDYSTLTDQELIEELEVATGPKREMLLSHLGIEVNLSYGQPKKKTTKNDVVYLDSSDSELGQYSPIGSDIECLEDEMTLANNNLPENRSNEKEPSEKGDDCSVDMDPSTNKESFNLPANINLCVVGVANHDKIHDNSTIKDLREALKDPSQVGAILASLGLPPGSLSSITSSLPPSTQASTSGSSPSTPTIGNSSATTAASGTATFTSKESSPQVPSSVSKDEKESANKSPSLHKKSVSCSLAEARPGTTDNPGSTGPPVRGATTPSNQDSTAVPEAQEGGNSGQSEYQAEKESDSVSIVCLSASESDDEAGLYSPYDPHEIEIIE